MGPQEEHRKSWSEVLSTAVQAYSKCSVKACYFYSFSPTVPIVSFLNPCPLPQSPYQSPIGGLVWGDAAPGEHVMEQGIWRDLIPRHLITACSACAGSGVGGERVGGYWEAQSCPPQSFVKAVLLCPLPQLQALGWLTKLN